MVEKIHGQARSQMDRERTLFATKVYRQGDNGECPHRGVTVAKY